MVLMLNSEMLFDELVLNPGCTRNHRVEGSMHVKSVVAQSFNVGMNVESRMEANSLPTSSPNRRSNYKDFLLWLAEMY